MKVKNKIDQHCKQLRLSALGGQVQHLADAAAAEGISYLEFAGRLLETEIAHRNQNDMLRKIRFAKLPAMHELQAYDCAQVQKECRLQNFNNSKSSPGWIKILTW